MTSPPRRILTTLDNGLDCCVKNWQVVVVLMPAATFVFFTVVLFFGLTVRGALAITQVLAAIELALAGVVLLLHLKYRRQISRWLDAADAIEAMLCKDDAFSDWDEFIAKPAGDPEVEWIRLHCLTLPQEFPAPDEYCNQQGIDVLEGYMRHLRAGLATRALDAFVRARRAWRDARNPADWDAPAPGEVTLLDEPEFTTIMEPTTTKKPTRAKKPKPTKKPTRAKKPKPTKKASTTKKAATTAKKAKQKWVA